MVFDALDDELGLFYSIGRQESDMYHRWAQIETMTTNVVDGLERILWYDRARKAVMRSRELAKLAVSLTQFEMDYILNEQYTKQSYQGVYEHRELSFLRSFVDASVRDRPIFPTHQMIDLIKFLEDRRSKAVELAVILIAAAVGGIVGAVVTLMATS